MQTTDGSSPSNYYAALLRLWRDGSSGKWRASLQDVEGNEPIGFADLDRLFVYLYRRTMDTPDEYEQSTPGEHG